MHKVAVFIPGLPRLLEQSMIEMKQFIFDPLDATIFCCFWEPEIMKDDIRSKEAGYRISKDSVCSFMENMFSGKYRLKFENYDERKYEFQKDYRKMQKYVSIERGLAQFYMVRQAYNMVKQYQEENKMTFDVIIRSRTELLIKNFIGGEVLSRAGKGILMVPDDHDHGGINDRFALSSPEIMEKYSKFYDCIDEYCGRNGMTFHAETTLLHHLKVMKMPIQRFGFCTGLNQ